MSALLSLEPTTVWTIFDEITKIPRPSKHEEKIREYLRDFASKHNLDFREDAKGNIVIYKGATSGYENHPGVILQSHVDMVCEKSADSTHNFDTDPIETYTEDGWVKARGTTLGADCGIGMALQMAVLIAENTQHPAIEALFTVDEEMGLTGAMELGDGMLTHKRMVNLDSEDEGEIFIGCAGGIDTIAKYVEKKKRLTTSKYEFYTIEVGGLKGGHSGDDINKGRANANRVLARIVRLLTEKYEGRLCSIEGGNLRNAIARDAVAEVALPREQFILPGAKVDFDLLSKAICEEYAVTEPDMTLKMTPIQGVISSRKWSAYGKKSARRILTAVLGVQNGVVEMSASMPGLVETSTNLASIKPADDNGTLIVTSSQRSSIESARNNLASSIASIYALSGAEVTHSDGYPGWKPNPDSEFVRTSHRIYKEMFGVEPKVKAIHAGLECGLLLSKYPGMDIISIGPTLRDVHSPSERLEISTVQKTWDYLCELLKQP